MLYLSNELFKQRDQVITFHIGQSVNAKGFHSNLNEYKVAQEFKKTVYSIKENKL